MEVTPLTAADVGAVVNKNHGYGYGDSFGCGGSWVWVILLFALFGGGGFGYGRNGNGITQLELQEGFNNQSVMRKLDGLSNGLCDSSYALNNSLKDGFYATQSAISENRFAQQECCCQTNRNIDAVRYENAKNTCDIVRAIEKNEESIKALINQTTTQNLRDKLAEKDQMLQTANFQLSQQAQSANLINILKPTPIPAYQTCSPYQATTMFSGCGCGCGNFA